MIKQFLETFRKPSARVIAQRELEDAERELLATQTASEYAKNLVQYHQQRIQRLKTYLLLESQA